MISTMSNFPKTLFLLFFLAGFTGLLDSAYLTIEHYRGESITCGVLEGCQKVVASQYSTIGEIPVSLLGVFYYLSVLFLIVILRKVWNRFPPSGWGELLRRLIPILTTVGFLFTLYLLYLMFFVIKAICIYCLGSALSSTVLFLLGIYLFWKHLESVDR